MKKNANRSLFPNTLPNVVSITIKSYTQLNFLNLVTMATAKIRRKKHFDANKEGSKEYIGFGKSILVNCGFHGNKIF